MLTVKSGNPELPGGSEGFFDVDTPEELARAEERA